MTYSIHKYEDAASFGAEVSSFLMKDEDKNSLLIGLLKLVSGPNAEVCQTYCAQPISIKITSVYTPTQWRGKNYASNCVAGVTKRLLADGCKEVFFTLT